MYDRFKIILKKQNNIKNIGDNNLYNIDINQDIESLIKDYNNIPTYFVDEDVYKASKKIIKDLFNKDIKMDYDANKAYITALYKIEIYNNNLDAELRIINNSSTIDAKEECMARFSNHMKDNKKVIEIYPNLIEKRVNQDKEQILIETASSFYHEIRHAMINDLVKQKNIYNLDVLQMAIDTSLRLTDALVVVNNIYKYYYDGIDSEYFEERLARIYGKEKALELYTTYKDDKNSVLVKKQENEINKLKSIDNNHKNYTIYEDENRLLIANILLDDKITTKIELLEQFPSLNIMYKKNGRRKMLHELVEEKQEKIEELSNKINNSLINTSKEQLLENKLFFENQISELNKIYNELIYIELTKTYTNNLDYLFNCKEDIIGALDYVYQERKQRLTKNDIDQYNNIINKETHISIKKVLTKELKNIKQMDKTKKGYISTQEIVNKYENQNKLR